MAVPAGKGSSTVARRRGRLGLWLLRLYILGIALDVAWHLNHYLTTGDHKIETYEWVTGVQASLFWPVDLVAQLLLAMR